MKRLEKIIVQLKDDEQKLIKHLTMLYSFLNNIGASNSDLLAKTPLFSPAQYQGRYHLATQNEAIIRLINQIEIDESSGEVRLLNDNGFELISEVFGQNYLVEIKNFLLKLNGSGILCLQVLGRTDSENHHRIQIPQTEKCKCIRCQWDRFELKILLEQIDSRKPSLHNLSGEEMPKEAFVNYQIGRIYESFLWLNQIVGADSSNLISKGTAEHNMKMIESAVAGLTVSAKREIQPIIEKLDLYNRIAAYSLETLERSFLEDIHQQKFLQNKEWEIDRQIEEIGKTKKIYSGQGFRMSAHHVALLEEAFTLTYLFYFRNCLFEIRHGRFRRLVKKLWEGLVSSYTTNEAYEYRLKKFRWFHIKMAIRNLGAKELSELLQECGLDNFRGESKLRIGEKDFRDFLLNANNFFSSNHYPKEDFPLGNGLIENHLFSAELNKNIRFNTDVERYSQNFLFFLARIQVPENLKAEFGKLLNTIYDFVAIEIPRSTHFTFEYIADIIAFQVDVLSKDQIEKFLLSLLQHRLPDGKTFRRALKSLKKIGFILESEILWKEIQNSFIERDGRQLEPKFLIGLFPLLSSDKQVVFKTLIINAIESPARHKEWDFDLYLIALENNLFHPSNNELFSIFLQYCQKAISRFEDSIILASDRVQFKNDLNPFNRTRAFVRVVRKFELAQEQYQEILDQDHLPNSVKWILNPEEFESDLFDPRWLYIFNEPIFFRNQTIPKEQREKIETSLAKSFQEELAKIYFSILK